MTSMNNSILPESRIKPLQPTTDDEPLTIYVAGPMTGIEDKNKHRFALAAIDLRKLGYNVLTPIEMDEEDGISLEAEAKEPGDWHWALALGRDIHFVIQHADLVVVLPGWETSRGCFLETEAAYAKGIPVLAYPDLRSVMYEAHPNRSTGKVAPASAYDHGPDKNLQSGTLGQGAPTKFRCSDCDYLGYQCAGCEGVENP